MENCLVTKLKITVNNDNLTKIGEILFQIDASKHSGETSRYIILGQNEGVSGIALTIRDTGQQIDANLIAPNENCVVSAISKYNINQMTLIPQQGGFLGNIVCITPLIDCIKWSPNIKKITMMFNEPINVSDFEGIGLNTIEEIDLRANPLGVYGDVSSFSDHVALKLFLMNEYYGNLTGNISAFAKCTLLEHLFTGSSAMTGSITNLAELQVTNGRTSGTLTIYDPVATGRITVDGSQEAAGKNWVITFDSSLPNGYSIA